MPCAMVKPAAPPAMLFNPKAPSIIIFSTSGSFARNIYITAAAAIIYTALITGTILPAAEHIPFAPPLSTIYMSAAVIMPAISFTRPICSPKPSAPAAEAAASASVFDCTMLPQAREAKSANTENAAASGHAPLPMPSTIQYMVPPALSFPPPGRYLIAISASAYLVAMPSMPLIHSQNIAPGPPIAIAPATPAMLPVPTQPPSAAEKAS